MMPSCSGSSSAVPVPCRAAGACAEREDFARVDEPAAAFVVFAFTAGAVFTGGAGFAADWAAGAAFFAAAALAVALAGVLAVFEGRDVCAARAVVPLDTDFFEGFFNETSEGSRPRAASRPAILNP